MPKRCTGADLNPATLRKRKSRALLDDGKVRLVVIVNRDLLGEVLIEQDCAAFDRTSSRADLQRGLDRLMAKLVDGEDVTRDR